jgi:signal peptidase I
MKKYQLILLVVFTVIVAIVIIGRTTNALQFYSIPTHSNEPTFKTGSLFLASNLKTPKRMDFICYKSSVPEYYNQVWFHRLVGLPGDTVLIKDGDLYINGIIQDLTINLKKEYVVQRDLVASLNFGEDEAIPQGVTDSLIVILETITHKDIIKQGRRYIYYNEDQEIKRQYGQPWTIHNFGPYVVKPNNYFVLGDNRSRAMDSRYSGPVKKENYVSTLFKN